jgi:hypothetical protein
MAHEVPSYIAFEEYSEHVPGSIPLAVKQATDRFVKGRAARVAELPQWEELRQIGSDIRLHTIENLDVYFIGRKRPMMRIESSFKSPEIIMSRWQSNPSRWRPKKLD